MKKLFFISLFLLSVNINVFSQKKFIFYNFTSHTVEIGTIAAIDSVNELPQYDSSIFGIISVPPFGSYTLENTAYPQRFPFHSPLSTPYIDEWNVYNPPSSPTIENSIDAWVAGDDQVFYYVKFQVGTGGSLGGGTIGNSDYGIPTSIQGNGWSATYTMPPNTQTYNCIIFP